MNTNTLIKTGLVLVGGAVVGRYLLDKFTAVEEAPVDTPPDEEGVVNFGGYRRIGNGEESSWANAGRADRLLRRQERWIRTGGRRGSPAGIIGREDPNKKVVASSPSIRSGGWQMGGGGNTIVSPHSGTFVTNI